MTLTTSHNRKAYTAGAGATIFAYDFLIEAATDLTVYVDGVLQPTANYTISGVGLGSGGNVTFAAAMVGGEKIVFLRATDPTQQVNLVEGDKLPAESVETVFDKVYALAQDLVERVFRAIKVPKTSANATTEMDLPDPALAANFGKALRIKADGTGIEPFTVLATDIASPITAKGDLIRGSAANTPERVAIGADGKVLTASAGQASWETPVTGIPATLLDAKGDLIVATAADTAARKAVGTTGAALLADPSTTDGLAWVLGAGAHGRVILRRSSATLLALDPRDGNTLYVKDANGWRLRSIGAGLTAANTSIFLDGVGASNLAASTVYLVTVFDNAGTLTIDFRTTLTRATDADFGVEIATGQPTRTVVGLIRTDASSQFADSATQRFVRSWFNGAGVTGANDFTANRTTASAPFVELNTEIRIEFLVWSGESVMALGTGTASNSTAGATCSTGIVIDGGTQLGAVENESNSANDRHAATPQFVSDALAEGYHYASLSGGVSGGGTGTWIGSGGADRYGLGILTSRR